MVIDHGERAELGTEEYEKLGEVVMENLVILKKNPNYVEEDLIRK